MNKVYLLLRNNQQTGPYSLEELTNLPLKPFDLIWVEGKSFGWSYPVEIEALKPYVASATGAPPVEPSPQAAIPSTPEPRPVSKKIFVSLPENAAARPAAQPKQQPQPQFLPQPQSQYHPQAEASTSGMLEQKAEELRQRIQSQAAESSARPVNEPETRYARSINDVEEDYTSWVFKQKAKKKKTPGMQWAAAVLVLGLAGYYGWSMMAGDQETAQPQALAQSAPDQQAVEPEQTLPEDAVMSVADSPLPIAEKKKEKGQSSRIQQQEEKRASTLPQVQEDEPAATSPAVQETPPPAPPVVETPSDNGAKEESTVSAEPKKERKKLGKAINNVLEKLKGNRQDETVEEAPKSVTGSSGERRAVRRGEDNSVVADAPNLAAQIKLVASERPENWMMGVVGQKLTLYNLSNQTIRSATVEVLYYNEQNKLLEKKQIQFTNIGPSRTKTLPIPDHRLADHASYKVITASGDEEAYARR